MTGTNQGKQHAVIIMGMHRSGTSAFARVLNLLGVDLGSSFLEADSANPRGYWEHLEIYDTHERLLNSMGRVWHSIFPFPEGYLQLSSMDFYKKQLINVVTRDFSRTKLWGLKDPRLCRLLPIWHSVFDAVGCEPLFVFVIRNPAEVVASLMRRDGFSESKCYIMWLLHTLESERDSRRYPRIFVTYDQILSDWKSVVTRIGDRFNLDWPNNPVQVESAVSSFLSPDLRHHRKPALSEDGSVIIEMVRDVYKRLEDAANGDAANPLFEELSRVESTLAGEISHLHGSNLEEELKFVSLRLSETEGWVVSLEQEMVRMENRFREETNTLYQSWSWKLTTPLRKIYDVVVGESKK